VVETTAASVLESMAATKTAQFDFISVRVPHGRGDRAVEEPFLRPIADIGHTPASFTMFADRMRCAGFQSHRGLDEPPSSRCACGGDLEARGFYRNDPCSYRAFSVCIACDAVHEEI
jgi:hypothetical protein